MAFIAGKYDPANPPADTGAAASEMPRESEDLNFNPNDVHTGDGMGKDDDDMADILDAIGGDDLAITADQTPVEKPLAEMTLVEQLQAQALKMKKASEAPVADAPPVEKPASEMTLVEQLQAQALKMKLASAAPKADVPEKPKPEKRLEDMTLEEQLAYSAARLTSNKPAADKPKPEKKLEDMTLEEQLAYSAARLTSNNPAADKPKPEKKLEDMTLEEQLAYSAARLTSNKPAADKPKPEKRVEDMTLEEQLAHSAARLKPAKAAAPVEIQVVVEEETKDVQMPVNDRFKDSFRSDASFIDEEES